jgi:carbon-monoxide dehydrogenase large subunit
VSATPSSERQTPWVGRPLRRREDLRFLQGRGQYVDDIVRPGMLHLAMVRSPLAHAALLSVRADEALRRPGVVSVVTGRDLEGRLRALPFIAPPHARVAPVPHPILAGDRVRYVGEPVAAVLAESRAAAVDAAEAVAVEYDPLPPLLDPTEALRGQILLHPALGDNVLLRWQRASGDVEGAFRAAAHVVRETYHIPRLAAAPLESRGAVASYDAGADLLTIWCSSQDPYRPAVHLSHVLNRPPERIRFVVPDVGGAFGSKGTLPPEAALAAYLAIVHHHPVKWVEDRRENLAAAYQGRGMDAVIELAVGSDGQLLALRAHLVADLGAYLHPLTPMPPITAAMLMTGVYAFRAAHVDMLGVATTRVPTGPYRGAGRPEATYVLERTVDRAAYALGRDPIEFRRQSLIASDRFPYDNLVGYVYDSGDYARLLDRLCDLVGYARVREEQAAQRREGRLVGVGVSAYVERAGERLSEHAYAVVDAAGNVTVRVGSTPQGQGHETTFGQIAADELGVDPQSVAVRQGDSAALPHGEGTFGSRSVTIGGSALLLALRQIKEKMTALAARLLEADVRDIVWVGGNFVVHGAPARGLTFAAVAAAAHDEARLPAGMTPGLEARAEFALPGPVFPSGACAAVVEVSPETGGVKVRRLAAVDDAGRVINPLLADGQVLGASVQGLGQALQEEAVYDPAGQLLTATFLDYALPRAPQIPPMVSELVETPSPFNPLGAKGIGEAGAIGTPAAVTNAVLDALRPLGIDRVDLPLTPAKLWAALRRRP